MTHGQRAAIYFAMGLTVILVSATGSIANHYLGTNATVQGFMITSMWMTMTYLLIKRIMGY